MGGELDNYHETGASDGWGCNVVGGEGGGLFTNTLAMIVLQVPYRVDPVR